MALVFLTLGLIILALVLLTRLPRLSGTPKKEQDVTTSSPSKVPAASLTAGSGPSDEEMARVAAIAVALLRSRGTKRARTKASSETSRWKQYGRAHQLGL
jgi:hypothetical protein